MIGMLGAWNRSKTSSEMFERAGKHRHHPHEEGQIMLYDFTRVNEHNKTFFESGYREGDEFAGD